MVLLSGELLGVLLTNKEMLPAGCLRWWNRLLAPNFDEDKVLELPLGEVRDNLRPLLGLAVDAAMKETLEDISSLLEHAGPHVTIMTSDYFFEHFD